MSDELLYSARDVELLVDERTAALTAQVTALRKLSVVLMTALAQCPNCWGTGAQMTGPMAECTVCDGTGLAAAVPPADGEMK